MNASAASSSVDPQEAEHFGRLAAEWWDPKGSSAMLHRMNPARLGYIRDAINQHWALDECARRPLEGKSALDVGCGAGLICEPLARLGADVTGIDAAEENIAAATAHAEQSGLAIDYIAGGVEAASGAYDLVTCLEVVEHVAEPEAFIAALAGLVKPDGLLVMSTPNRTMLSRLAMITLGEGVGFIPRGTHDWSKFIQPEELPGGGDVGARRRSRLAVPGRLPGGRGHDHPRVALSRRDRQPRREQLAALRGLPRGGGLQAFGTDLVGYDSAQPRTDSVATFNAMFEAALRRSDPDGPGLHSMFDAVTVTLLAMESAEEINGTSIRDNIRKVTAPDGEPVHPGPEGIAKARELLAAGKTIRYVGATGPLQFDENGDVQAPKLTWRFEGDRNVEMDYYSTEEVADLIMKLDN